MWKEWKLCGRSGSYVEGGVSYVVGGGSYICGKGGGSFVEGVEAMWKRWKLRGRRGKLGGRGGSYTYSMWKEEAMWST